MINTEKLKRVDDFLNRMIDDEQIPGAVYGIINENETIAENALGMAHKKLAIPMHQETLFDIASLTKVCATLPGILLLIEEGLLELDDPVKRFFPDAFSAKLTIRHLLTHTSGLPAHIPFYSLGLSKEQVKDFIIGRSSVIGYDINPGEKVVYSDLNFILLGFLIEKMAGKPLDVFAKQYIYDPLSMSQTGFNPEVDKEKVAPTEFIQDKNDYQWGTVHDENAGHLQGVSGHAGVFSNLVDLKKYVRMLLQSGLDESGHSFLSPTILAESRRNYTESLNLNRGLGWQLADDSFSPLGYFLSRKSYGHTGFTGTSFWIDPEHKLGVILLTNRVHISRDINMNRVRRIFHNLVAAAIE